MNKQQMLLNKLKQTLPDEMVSELLSFTEFLEMKYLKEKYYVPQTPENGLESFFGKWPGNETDKEWNEMLERLS